MLIPGLTDWTGRVVIRHLLEHSSESWGSPNLCRGPSCNTFHLFEKVRKQIHLAEPLTYPLPHPTALPQPKEGPVCGLKTFAFQNISLRVLIWLDIRGSRLLFSSIVDNFPRCLTNILYKETFSVENLNRKV